MVDPTEELACFVGPGDSVRYAQAGDFSSVLLIGDATRIHTIEFYYPVVTASGNEGAPAFFEAIFPYLFPDWPEAAQWPLDSLLQSWSATGLAMADPTVSVNGTIARHREAGAGLATHGVPPDVIWYRVTARPECEKVSPWLLASPREPLKDNENFNPAQLTAQLQFNYIHPRPVDVSATPFFLGTVSASNRTPGTSLTFEGLASTVETNEWTQRQVGTDRYVSTTDAIRESWGYQSYYLYLITDPVVPVLVDGKPAMAAIETMSSDVHQTAAGDLKIRPDRAVAVFFSSAIPSTLRTVEAPDIEYVGGDFVRYVIGAAPVDVSATPIYLGHMWLYHGGVSGDRPGYYAIARSGLGITVKDRLTGEETRIDLRPWANANGMDTAAIGGHLMRDPVVHFDLAGKPHVLLIEQLEVNREGLGQVESLSGHVFSAR